MFEKFIALVNGLIIKDICKSVSETSKCRSSLASYCVGNGIDIGFGGDPIVPYAICMDQPSAYAHYDNYVQHLHGDAKNLYWFQSNSLDFVYSSHVLEDFEDTKTVLKEWLRVIKPGGNLVLYLPDEQTYRRHCEKQGKPHNIHHIHENFSLDYVKHCLADRDDLSWIHEKYPVGVYSFELVLQKKK